MFVSIGFAARSLGVAVSTLRRWHSDGYLVPAFRTKGGHRRYSLSDLEKFTNPCDSPKPKKTVLYARTSGHDQQADLTRQIERLQSYSEQHGYPEVALLKVKGSGLNYNATGLKKLVRLIFLGEIERIVLISKDRLLRFGADLIFHMCQLRGIEIVILDEELKESFEQELTFDLICILTVFTSKLYGKRSHKNRRKQVEKLVNPSRPKVAA